MIPVSCHHGNMVTVNMATIALTEAEHHTSSIGTILYTNNLTIIHLLCNYFFFENLTGVEKTISISTCQDHPPEQKSVLPWINFILMDKGLDHIKVIFQLLFIIFKKIESQTLTFSFFYYLLFNEKLILSGFLISKVWNALENNLMRSKQISQNLQFANLQLFLYHHFQVVSHYLF